MAVAGRAFFNAACGKADQASPLTPSWGVGGPFRCRAGLGRGGVCRRKRLLLRPAHCSLRSGSARQVPRSPYHSRGSFHLLLRRFPSDLSSQKAMRLPWDAWPHPGRLIMVPWKVKGGLEGSLQAARVLRPGLEGGQVLPR